MTLRETAREIAARHNLKRRPDNRGWKGDCPACNYASGFTLRDCNGKAVWWCASCGEDREALTRAVLGAPGYVSEGRGISSSSDDATRTEQATALWNAALPIRDRLAALYLPGRGLSLPNGDALRWVPNARHPASGWHPCMIALAVDGAGRGQAVHRTFLTPDGTRKATLDPARMTLGPIGGAVVRLCRWREGQPLVIGEGIETSLSAGILAGAPAWAALSAGNMKAVQLPKAVREVWVAADHDMPGQREAWAAADVFMAQGRKVRVLTPDTPGDDFNDVLMRQAAQVAAHA